MLRQLKEQGNLIIIKLAFLHVVEAFLLWVHKLFAEFETKSNVHSSNDCIGNGGVVFVLSKSI